MSVTILEPIPVLDFELEHAEQEDWKGKCHLLNEHYGKPLCECPTNYGVTIEHYHPGPVCEWCGKLRCAACVAVLEAQ